MPVLWLRNGMFKCGWPGVAQCHGSGPPYSLAGIQGATCRDPRPPSRVGKIWNQRGLAMAWPPKPPRVHFLSPYKTGIMVLF